LSALPSPFITLSALFRTMSRMLDSSFCWRMRTTGSTPAGARPRNRLSKARLGLTIGSFFWPRPRQEITPTLPPPR
jgi:hypothetical protein